MKTATRIAALLLLICIVVSTLASCKADGKGKNYLGDSTADFSALYDSEPVTEGACEYDETNVTELDLGERIIVASGGSLIVVNDSEKIGVYTVMDIKSGEELMTYESEDGKEATVSVLGGELILFSRTHRLLGSYRKIYNVRGECIADLESDGDVSYDLGVLYCGNDVFTLDYDCRLVSHFEIPIYVSAAEVSFGEKYAAIETEGGITYYSESFEKVSSFALPKTVNNALSCFLGPDKAFISYVRQLPPDSKSYDFFSGDVKYDVFVGIYTISDGTVEEIEENIYPVGSITGRALTSNGGFGIRNDFSNIIAYYPIEDGNLVAEESNLRYSFIGADGKVGERLDDMIDGQIGMFEPIRNGGYYVRLEFGSALLSHTGEVVSTFPTATALIEKEFGSVAIDGTTVRFYDEDMKLIHSASTGSELISISDKVAIFTEGSYYNNYRIFDGKTVNTVNRYLENGIYIMGMNVYSASGELLMTGANVSLETYSEGVTLLKVNDKYYIVKK